MEVMAGSRMVLCGRELLCVWKVSIGSCVFLKANIHHPAMKSMRREYTRKVCLIFRIIQGFSNCYGLTYVISPHVLKNYGAFKVNRASRPAYGHALKQGDALVDFSPKGWQCNSPRHRPGLEQAKTCSLKDCNITPKACELYSSSSSGASPISASERMTIPAAETA